MKRRESRERDPYFSVEAEYMIAQHRERLRLLHMPHTRRFAVNELVIAGGKKMGHKVPKEAAK